MTKQVTFLISIFLIGFILTSIHLKKGVVNISRPQKTNLYYVDSIQNECLGTIITKQEWIAKKFDEIEVFNTDFT